MAFHKNLDGHEIERDDPTVTDRKRRTPVPQALPNVCSKVIELNLQAFRMLRNWRSLIGMAAPD